LPFSPFNVIIPQKKPHTIHQDPSLSLFLFLSSAPPFSLFHMRMHIPPLAFSALILAASSRATQSPPPYGAYAQNTALAIDVPLPAYSKIQDIRAKPISLERLALVDSEAMDILMDLRCKLKVAIYDDAGPLMIL
jgi:hypothetical protein